MVLVYLSLADKTVLHLPSLGFRSEESLAHSCAEGRGLLHSALWFTSVDCEKQFHMFCISVNHMSFLGPQFPICELESG